MDMTLVVDVDEQQVLDNMTAEEIFDKSGMDESNCKEYFGDSLLNQFSEAEVIEHFGIDVATE